MKKKKPKGRTAFIAFRVPEDFKRTLEELAAKYGGGLSSFSRALLMDAVSLMQKPEEVAK